MADDHDHEHMVPEAKSKLAAVPEKPLQQAAEAKIREIFRQEFAEAKTSKARAALAKKLIEQADGTKDDTAAHYVLLRMAGEQAVAGGDVAQAMEVVDKLQADFPIDSASMKADVLAAIMRQPISEKTADHGYMVPAAVFDMAMKLGEDAMTRDDYAAGRPLCQGGRGGKPQIARHGPEPAHRCPYEGDRAAEGEVRRRAKGAGRLESDASDGAANLVAGQWYCFTKGDWDKGLPMLAKAVATTWPIWPSATWPTGRRQGPGRLGRRPGGD